MTYLLLMYMVCLALARQLWFMRLKRGKRARPAVSPNMMLFVCRIPSQQKNGSCLYVKTQTIKRISGKITFFESNEEQKTPVFRECERHVMATDGNQLTKLKTMFAYNSKHEKFM